MPKSNDVVPATIHPQGIGRVTLPTATVQPAVVDLEAPAVPADFTGARWACTKSPCPAPRRSPSPCAQTPPRTRRSATSWTVTRRAVRPLDCTSTRSSCWGSRHPLSDIRTPDTAVLADDLPRHRDRAWAGFGPCPRPPSGRVFRSRPVACPLQRAWGVVLLGPPPATVSSGRYRPEGRATLLHRTARAHLHGAITGVLSELGYTVTQTPAGLRVEGVASRSEGATTVARLVQTSPAVLGAWRFAERATSAEMAAVVCADAV